MPHVVAVGARVRPAATRHLIHRPQSTVHAHAAAGAGGEERFALAGDLSDDHPLFNDNLGQVHDAQLFVEIARQVGTFIGRRFFRIPLNRACRFDSIGFALTTPAAWRVRGGCTAMSMDIQAAPTATGGIRLRSTMDVDAIAGLVGHADLSFSVSQGGRRHRAAVPLWGRTDHPPPAGPHTVGRYDPHNVVVSAPLGTGTAVSTRLLVDPSNPVFFPERSEVVPGLLLVEAIRQTSVLTATRAHGFSAPHSCVTGASVRFPGDATLDAPLTCAARAEPAGTDLDGRPSVRVCSTITQLDRVVAEAEVTLTQLA